MKGVSILSLLLVAAACQPSPQAAGQGRYVSGQDGYAGYRPAIETAADGSLLAFLAEAAEVQPQRPRRQGERDRPGAQAEHRRRRHLVGDAGHRALRRTGPRPTRRPWSIAERPGLGLHLRCKPGREPGRRQGRGRTTPPTRARYSDDHGVTWSEPIDQTGVARDMADANWRISVPAPAGRSRTGRAG